MATAAPPSVVEAVLAADTSLLHAALRVASPNEAKPPALDTPLHVACRTGWFDGAEILLSKSASVVAQNAIGEYPLHCAVENGALVLVEYLFKKGAKIDAVDNKRETALHVACYRSPPAIRAVLVKALIKNGASLNCVDEKGQTPLHLACLHGSGAAARVLLEYGAKPHTSDLKGNQPIHCASISGLSDVISILLSMGASLGARNLAGDTPLHEAAYHAKSSVFTCNQLIENHADIEATNLRGETPLFRACSKASMAVSYLIENKASITPWDVNQSSMLHSAAQAASPLAVEKLLQFDKSQLESVDKFGNSPLHIAAQRGNIHTIEVLLRARASIDATTMEGNTPLHVACAAQHTSTALLLISQGADLCKANAADQLPLDLFKTEQISISVSLEALTKGVPSALPYLKRCETQRQWEPLHIATAAGNFPAISTLIHYGYNLCDQKNGLSAIDMIPKSPEAMSKLLWIACMRGDTKATAELIERGADINAFDPDDGESLLLHAFTRNKRETARILIECGANLRVRTKNTGQTVVSMILENDTYLLASIISACNKKGVIDLSGYNLKCISNIAAAMLVSRATALDLRFNLLESIHPELAKIEKVKFSDNPLSLVPERIRLGGWQQMRKYLRTIAQRASLWNECRLILVGEEGVGKTLECFKKRKGKVSCKENLSTDGIQIHKGFKFKLSKDKTADDKDNSSPSVVFNAWDLGGQEVFYPTHQFFLTSNSIYLVIFNLANVGASRIDYWMRLIRNLSGNTTKAPIFLVGTHADDPGVTPEQIDDVLVYMNEHYPKYRFLGLCGISAVSCRTGLGVDALRRQLLQVGAQTCSTVASSWVRLHDCIQEQRPNNGVVLWTQYRQWALNCNILTDDELKMATTFLSDAGALIHYDDENTVASALSIGYGEWKNCRLSDLVVLDPQWLASVMASLITFRHRWIKNGVLELSVIGQVFENQPAHLHHALLALFEKFSIIYRLRGSDSVIIPSMLPVEPPDDVQDHWPPVLPADWFEFGRKYTFPFMPHGFFGRMLVRCLHLIETTGLVFWRSGLILKSQQLEQVANLQFDPETYSLLIRVRIPTPNLARMSGPAMLLRQLIEAVETLLDCYYHRVSVTRLVMCSHCAQLRVPNLVPFFFTYSECLDLAEAGGAYCFCQHIRSPSRCVRIDLLAPDIVFADLSVINESDLTIQHVIGQGGFGQIFQAVLRRPKRKRKIRDIIREKLNLRSRKSGPPREDPDTDEDELDPESSIDATNEPQFIELPVAVKELKTSDVGSRENKFRDFQTEAYIMSCLNHPNLVKLHGIMIKPRFRLVIELVVRGDLSNLLHPPLGRQVSGWLPGTRGTISKEDFPWRLRLLIALDVARGMRYLASLNPPIVHRDLRSPNIFLVSTSPDAPVRAKVADFGLAKIVATEISGALRTWQWLAPEVLAAVPRYDERSDIYSFGMCCWEIATRQYPYDEFQNDLRFIPAARKDDSGKVMSGFSANQLCLRKAVLDDDLRPTLPPPEEECPPEFARLITRCWARDPSARPSFHDIVLTLCAILGIQDLDPFIGAQPSAFRSLLVNKDDPLSLVPRGIDLQRRSLEAPAASLFRSIANFEASTTIDATIWQSTLIDGLLWVGCSDGTIWVINPQSFAFIRKWQAHLKGIRSMVSVRLNKETHWVWTSADDGTICVWDSSSDIIREWLPFGIDKTIPVILPVQANGRLCVWTCCPADHEIRIFAADTQEILHIVAFEDDCLCMARVQEFVVLGQPKRLSVVSIESHSTVGIIECRETVTSLMALGDQLWVGKDSGSIDIYQFVEGSVVLHKSTNVHSSLVDGLTVLPGRRHVISTSVDKSVIVWDAKNFEPLQELDQHTSPVASVTVHVESGAFYTSDAHAVVRWSLAERSNVLLRSTSVAGLAIEALTNERGGGGGGGGSMARHAWRSSQSPPMPLGREGSPPRSPRGLSGAESPRSASPTPSLGRSLTLSSRSLGNLAASDPMLSPGSANLLTSSGGLMSASSGGGTFVRRHHSGTQAVRPAKFQIGGLRESRSDDSTTRSPLLRESRSEDSASLVASLGIAPPPPTSARTPPPPCSDALLE